MKDDEAMTSGMLSNAIEKAQRKVEGTISESERLLSTMDVMNYRGGCLFQKT